MGLEDEPFPQKGDPFFFGDFRQFFGGERGSSITPQALKKTIPSPLRLMYALRRLSRQQWACSLVSYQIDPSTLRHVGLPERNTSRGFDEVGVDPGGYPQLTTANGGYFR